MHSLAPIWRHMWSSSIKIPHVGFGAVWDQNVLRGYEGLVHQGLLRMQLSSQRAHEIGLAGAARILPEHTTVMETRD